MTEEYDSVDDVYVSYDLVAQPDLVLRSVDGIFDKHTIINRHFINTAALYSFKGIYENHALILNHVQIGL